MARRRTHTEKWWDAAAPHILRCTGHNKTDGSRCRAEASPGTTVCERHGALIPVVQQAAANRIQMSVDEAAQRLIEWLNDNDVDMRERVKIAHDLLDRGGLGATSKHLVGVVGSGDPVETLFRDILSDPSGLAPATPALPAPPVPDAAQAALDAREAGPDWEDVIGREIGSDDAHDVVDAELLPDADDLPPHTVYVGQTQTPKRIRDDLRRLI